MFQDNAGRVGEEENGGGRGRPSLNQQIEIEEKVWPYFRDGISATETAREVELDRKTVVKYYRKFAESRIQANDAEFIEQCKINIQSAEEAISDQISNLQKSEDKLKEVIDTFTKSPNFSLKTYLALQKELRETAKTISHLITLKTNLANSTTADMRLANLAKELIDKLV